jgi:hypothetical protein
LFRIGQKEDRTRLKKGAAKVAPKSAAGSIDHLVSAAKNNVFGNSRRSDFAVFWLRTGSIASFRTQGL